MKSTARIAMLLAAAALGIGASKPLPSRAPANWNLTAVVTPEGGHRVGNPAAKVKLVEYVSYTCPHCADFERRADGPMRLTGVRSGKLSIEVRHIVRDPVDMAVALLTNCGSPSKFFLNHSMMMRSQDKWIAPLTKMTAGQRDRWQNPDFRTRMRYIATDFHFYEMFATRGYDRRTMDACLADEAQARRLAAMGEAAETLGISSTPSFLLDGEVLVGTHNWELLQPQIAAKL